MELQSNTQHYVLLSLCSLTPGTQLPGPRSHAGHHCSALHLRGHSGLGRQVLQQPRLVSNRKGCVTISEVESRTGA